MDLATLTPDDQYAICSGRDARFDGMFVMAVATTGIYCRPSCPARTPHRRNASFYSTPAGAMAHGYRACKRCHPDATPGSPEWNTRQDVGARAMRMIIDGVVDREGVSGLAARMSYSERQLNRCLVDTFGVGAASLARTQRAFTARTLLVSTTLSMVDVAFASGFSSVRQFNETIREVFDATPRQLRATRHRAAPGPDGALRVRLAVREPFAWNDFLSFVAVRAIPGLEVVDDATYRREVQLPRGRGTVELRRTGGGVEATLSLSELADVATAVARCRAVLDADADPTAIDTILARIRPVRASVRAAPGLRSPQVFHPFEAVVRAVCTQGVSVAAGVGAVTRIVDECGADVVVDATAMAGLEPDALPVAGRHAAALVETARRVVAGDLSIEPGCDRAEARRGLQQVRGIGEWTAGYVAMRALADPDVDLGGDLIVRRMTDQVGLDAEELHRAAPWRSYLVHHLWRMQRDTPARPSTRRPPAEPTTEPEPTR